jgi:uncharacterized phage-associated protein
VARPQKPPREPGTATALDVARWLLFLASEEPGTTPRGNLDLQKHLYYVQGWALARLGRPLFTESMEAWTYGPVVPTVYAEYAQYGRTLIKAPAEDANQLTEDERSFVAAIWSDYKRFSAQKLVSMTHGEPPWKKARKGLAHDAPSRNIVHRSDMTAHFLKQVPADLECGADIVDERVLPHPDAVQSKRSARRRKTG